MKYDRQGFVEATDGTRLFYGVLGDGPTAVLLCDGIGCEGFAWRYLHPRLAARHRVIHCHYRGHGRSGPPVDTSRLSIEALTEEVKQVCDHLEVNTIVPIGHSMGVQVALEFYRQNPDSVRALVLMCGTFGRLTETFHGTSVLHQLLPHLLGGARAYPMVARALWGRVPASIAFQIACAGGEVDADRIQEEDFRRYWEHASLMDPDIFLRMLKLAGEHDAQTLLPEVGVPTLILAAERDTFTPMELAKEMGRAIPLAELEVVAGASHAAPVEQPDRIADCIEDFLDRH